jgi:hypothetical protein
MAALQGAIEIIVGNPLDEEGCSATLEAQERKSPVVKARISRCTV